MKVKVKCIRLYKDLNLDKIIKPEDTILVDEERATHLINLGFVELVEEEKKEDKKLSTKKAEKRK